MTEHHALTANDAEKAFLVKAAEYRAKDLADHKADGRPSWLEKDLLDMAVKRWRHHDPEGFNTYMDRLRARDETTR